MNVVVAYANPQSSQILLRVGPGYWIIKGA
ncbi:Uncharacterised protein [Candidatus Bartonella washoeensis]|uniref:Uncharacterized protein n=1 Tax=Candidatus Bartonella washoeensis Sb944nv TaxID=1094563 RepID=J1J857_9HYPH|nr:hypothetical protein MCQ_00553 [Bartonella washoeensis Sb944nv]SPU26093.1 Uncharacterised protein [Bartonella washoeensis]